MSRLSQAIREAAEPLTGTPYDFDSLLDRVGEARFVLLGESSHGTHEFYRERAEITKRLITEKGFNAVAVEADWPDAFRVNRFIRDIGDDEDATEALSGFKRFPQWMWRNADILDFIGWLRDHNDPLADRRKTGLYGLDLYSLSSSINAVLQYLEKTDAEAARSARQLYSCFDHYGRDVQEYGSASRFALSPTCEDEVVKVLMELQEKRAQYLQRDGSTGAGEYFSAAQNALVVKTAEEYYRALYRGGVSSWNLRDEHMMETFESLVAHLQREQGAAKIVVWAHNSHLGDARATQMSQRGELNLGQLIRQRHGHQSVLIGLTTHEGTVTAASEWDAPAERKQVRPSLKESYERLFHEAGHAAFWLDFEKHPLLAADLRGTRLERAIGVIYLPQTERYSHYFEARLPDQFDAILHFDHTRAVEPLERTVEWTSGEMAETFPTGF